MKNGKRVLAALAALLVAAALVWRLWPQRFQQVFQVEPAQVESLAAMAGFTQVEDGSLKINSYTLNDLSAGTDDFDAILGYLAGASYRPDLRNLLPWPNVQYGSEGTTMSVSLLLSWGTGPEGSATVSFSDKGAFVVGRGSQKGFLLYHLTDKAVLTALGGYIKAHGVQG